MENTVTVIKEPVRWVAFVSNCISISQTIIHVSIACSFQYFIENRTPMMVLKCGLLVICYN